MVFKEKKIIKGFINNKINQSLKVVNRKNRESEEVLKIESPIRSNNSVQNDETKGMELENTVVIDTEINL